MIPLVLATAQQVGGGTIVGGWDYILAAHGLFWGALALYTLRLARQGAFTQEQQR